LGAGTWVLGPVPGSGTDVVGDGRWLLKAQKAVQWRARTAGCLVLSCAVLCFAVLRYAVVLQCNQRQRFTAPACKWKQSCMLLRLPLSSLTMCSSRRGSGWLAGWLAGSVGGTVRVLPQTGQVKAFKVQRGQGDACSYVGSRGEVETGKGKENQGRPISQTVNDRHIDQAKTARGSGMPT